MAALRFASQGKTSELTVIPFLLSQMCHLVVIKIKAFKGESLQRRSEPLNEFFGH